MNGFIELTERPANAASDPEKFLISFNAIVRIGELRDGGCWVSYTPGNTIAVLESYDNIKEAIQKAGRR